MGTSQITDKTHHKTRRKLASKNSNPVHFANTSFFSKSTKLRRRASSLSATSKSSHDCNRSIFKSKSRSMFYSFFIIYFFSSSNLLKVQAILSPRNDNFFWNNNFIPDQQIPSLRQKVKEMFQHAYFSYLDNAFPEDELMPIACKGRRRDREKSRGDIDDILGNYTLTLIDALDTLPLYGMFDEFNHALKHASFEVKFNSKVIVSVFETNIRIVGGLIGGHTMVQKIKNSNKIPNSIKRKFDWYDQQLIDQAVIVADKLLVAFDTDTGLPRSRVSLFNKLHSSSIISPDQKKSTCTACAGTLILEFAALSHYTNDDKYYKAGMKTLDFLWRRKNLATNLLGQVINVENGNWVRTDAGIGAGSDSYYEYLYKGGVMLNDGELMDRFKIHYDAIEKHIFNESPIAQNVYMNKPQNVISNFADALWAFWPGVAAGYWAGMMVRKMIFFFENIKIMYCTQKHAQKF